MIINKILLPIKKSFNHIKTKSSSQIKKHHLLIIFRKTFGNDKKNTFFCSLKRNF